VDVCGVPRSTSTLENREHVPYPKAVELQINTMR
jgi:hypothetical protein